MKKVTEMLWGLARLRVILYSVASLWTCWATATSSLNISMLGWHDWFQTIGGCIASWCLVMMAFVDKSASELASGKIPGLSDVKIDEGSIKTTTTAEATPSTTVSTTVNEVKMEGKV